MTAPVLVTGGTGTLGRPLVAGLRAAGRDVRVLSRSKKEDAEGIEYVVGDVSTGSGLDAAVEGVETIVHCAGSAKGDEEKARHLVKAAAAANVKHIVYISVVGADTVPVVSGLDRMMFGYFAAKRAAERIIADSGVPWTTLRATQFHDFVVLTMDQLGKLPILMLWKDVQFQPVDAREVADRLVELALGEPSGLVPDLGGPRAYKMEDLAKDYLKARGKRRAMVSMKTPGKAAAAFREGANLAPEHADGRRTWEAYLAEHY